MPRSDRIRDLLRLIAEGRASSQKQIVESLGALGHRVTQATVSRDLHEVGAVKARIDGSTSYRLPDHLPHGDSDRTGRNLERSLREFALSVVTSGTMLVVRTAPGHAQLLARAIDLAEPQGVVGTVAGDDTIFVATTDVATADRLELSWLSGRDGRSVR